MPQDNTNPNYECNYHVPINRESLDHVIPAENVIIYSTNMNIQYSIENDSVGMKHPARTGILLGGLTGVVTGPLANKIVKSMIRFRGIYNSDALITNEGIALNLPSFELNKKGDKLKKLPPNPQYVLWRDIYFSKNGTLKIESAFNCQLNFVPEFETEENFTNRRESFYENVTNLRCSYTAECLKHARAFLDLNDKRKTIEWIERGLKSNVNRSEFDYFDELNSLMTQIVKEETEKKKKMVKEIDNFLVEYFQTNPGKAFTAESIMKRLEDELDNREWLEYLRKNIEGILNKLTFNSMIKTDHHQGRSFFFA